MKTEQKFRPVSLVFETQEEIDKFIRVITSAVFEGSDCVELHQFSLQILREFEEFQTAA